MDNNPYQAPETAPSELEHAASLTYVGFWLRTLAHIVDTLLIVLITTPPMLAIYGKSYLIGAHDHWGVWNILFSYVIPACLVVIFWRYKSATPGKMLVSAKVVDEATGGAPSYKQCVIRYIGYFVSFIPLLLGFIWVAFDKRKRSWHDMLAKTVVVKRQ